jgi:hypothetical protein
MFPWKKNKNNSKLSGVSIRKNIQGSSEITSPQLVQTFSQQPSQAEQVGEGVINKLKFLEKTSSETVEKTKEAFDRIKENNSLLYFGFLVVISMMVVMVLDYLDVKRSVMEKNNQDYVLYEKMINQEASMKILKNCLVVSKWLNPKCFEY